jgi:pimeloyl-ACP methyl ester carboxylesterase
VGAWETSTIVVRAADGRDLEVALAGPPDGAALFSHHGIPGAAEMLDPLVDAGAERNLRHITYSRPGYGRSSRLAGRTIADCIADVTAIADALGYECFYSVGSSGGAPHSIACAVLLPDRVIAAAAIASPAPIDAEGLDWTAGMGRENIAELAAAQSSDGEFEQYLEHAARSMLGASAEQLMTEMGDLVSESDRRAVRGALGEFMVRELAHSLSSGIWGWFDDDRALFRDWGVDLEAVRVPLCLWHGGEDRFVPSSHGEWLAARLGVEIRVMPDRGHLSVSDDSYGAVLDALLEHAPDNGPRPPGESRGVLGPEIVT